MRPDQDGGCGVASPASVEAPIKVNGAYTLQVDLVEKAYAALQARRKEEAENAAANKTVVVILTKQQADRLMKFLAWNISIPVAISQFVQSQSGDCYGGLRTAALSSQEIVDIHERVFLAR